MRSALQLIAQNPIQRCFVDPDATPFLIDQAELSEAIHETADA
jgi:hypothetical protein